MSTLAKIVSAIEKLPSAKVEELAIWLEKYRQSLCASDAVFRLYDEEEKRSV